MWRWKHEENPNYKAEIWDKVNVQQIFAANTITPDPSSSQWSKEEGVPTYFGIDTVPAWTCAE